jgi:DNA-directed RNA polymerase specialized sigma24 family protein
MTVVETVQKKQRESLYERIRRGLDSLAGILSHFGEGDAGFRLSVESPPRQSGCWSVRCALAIKNRTIDAEAHAYYGPEAAICAAVDQLRNTVLTEHAKPATECAKTAQQRWRENLSILLPMLERAAAQGRSADFFAFLGPHLGYLEKEARGRIGLLETENRVPKNELTASEIVDETALRVWDRFRQRPLGVPLHAWITEVLKEVVDELETRALREPPITAVKVQVENQIRHEAAKAEQLDRSEAGVPDYESDFHRWSYEGNSEDEVFWEDLFAAEAGLRRVCAR